MPSARVETAELPHTATHRARIGPLLTALGAAGFLAFALLTPDEYDQHLVMWVGLNAVLAVTVCPDDLAVTVAVAVPAHEALTFHRHV